MGYKLQGKKKYNLKYWDYEDNEQTKQIYPHIHKKCCLSINFPLLCNANCCSKSSAVYHEWVINVDGLY